MLSTRFIATLSALIAFFTFAFAAPLAVEQRGVVPELPALPVDLPTALTALQLKAHAILGQVDELVQTNLLEQNVGGILDDLIAAIKLCSADVGTLLITSTSAKRQELPEVDGLPGLDEITAIVEPFMTDINSIVNKITGVAGQNPAVGALLVTVSTTLTGLLGTVNTLVPGLLLVVTGLVHTLTTLVGGVLKTLGLGGLLHGLGL